MDFQGDKRRLRKAYGELVVESIRPNLFLTLSTNRVWTKASMRRVLKSFCARIDSELLGSTWAKQPADARTEGLFFIEHVESNTHAHGILRVPDIGGPDFPLLVERHWGRLCDGGSTNVQNDLYDPGRLVSYCTKEMPLGRFAEDQLMFTWEFMSL